jgi:site-specific recombinase XerD
MMDFSPEKIEKEGDYTYLYGKRKKTGNEYIVLVLPQIQALLDKYNYNMPKYSNQQFNHRLKEVVKAAGIDKPVSSHWGRHTAAMMFLNNGIRIETVAKILGHSSTKITEQVYASILKKTVAEEMKSLIK